jgi:predicted phosphoadenosine phosphosulfate sulfurtransferase
MAKRYLDINVYEAAKDRIRKVYEDFEKVYVSFSGGKDSGVMLELAIEVAREMNRLPVNALYIDLEAQYRNTIEYVERMNARPEIKMDWVCLPLNLRNAVSQLQVNWTCWDEQAKDIWVRDMPGCAISDVNKWGWFKKGMEFERFIIDYAYEVAQGERCCTLVGIRAQESLNRYLAVASHTVEDKPKWKDYKWTSQIRKNLYNAYPLYDWQTEDIWIANGKFGWDYNRIYDLFNMANVPMKDMRICQPYGDDQKKGLYLFKVLEHDTWTKILNRVAGVNYGERYVHDMAMADQGKIYLPPGHTYKSYAELLLATMPEEAAANYRDKINKFITWWQKEGYAEIPDYGDVRLESKKKFPSWRRIVKVLLKNDYACKGLSFALTKQDKERQYQMIMKYNELL